MNNLILVINSGSSTIKWKLYDEELKVVDSSVIQKMNNKNPLNELEKQISKYRDKIKKVANRIVHGGPSFSETIELTEKEINELKNISYLAPLHNKYALDTIQFLKGIIPSAKHYGCFDTAFHHSIDEVRSNIGIPYDLANELNIKKYGMHGLSYKYIVKELEKEIKRPVNAIIAHLGNGSSVCAVENSKSIDTTMSLSPNNGLLMGTRSGDIDPSIFTILSNEKGMSIKDIDELLNYESGLKGVSGITNDMKKLLASKEPRAKIAIDVFVNRVVGYVAQYYNELNGDVDELILTGGIGENEFEIASMIEQKLQALNLIPRIMKTDEELMMATEIM